MMRAYTLTVLSLWFLVLPLTSWAADGPIRIPKPGEGYAITKTETTQAAPSGYEGRTDSSTLTAVGNTPATTGKRIVARFTLGNQIKTCPAADGTAEGRGVFSMSLDYTDTQAKSTSSLHIDMRAEGRYKGEVGDDAWIKNPVNAEIDYTYSLTGNMRDPSGAIATPAGSNVTQHITMPFAVSKDLTAPSLGAFSGGDPTQGRYAEAVGAGAALVYWAGVYYSVAQTKWRQDGTCVNVDFKPPSYTTRLVPGGRTTVEAEVKTKSGESVKAQFQGARARSGAGTVSPAGGPSDVGAPIKFTFIAPTQRANNASFTVGATSRAGVASGEWIAGLGTDWSGSISFTYINSGEHGSNELQDWSNSSVTTITVDLHNGKGTARGYTEMHDLKVNRLKTLQGGIVLQQRLSVDGSLEDSSPAEVEVINPKPGTYVVSVMYAFEHEGRGQLQDCRRNNSCTQTEQRVIITQSLPGIDGRIDDPNHLSGSKSDSQRASPGGTGTVTTTLTWNLAREGAR
jgi:hypothetical protein